MLRDDVEARVEEAARILRIEHLLDRPVSGLSSGDRQRVALGRAIVREPMAFLLDEPLGALDAEFREVMCGELRALHDRLKATTVYVTHDQLEAMAMADKIALMNHGVVEQMGTPQDIYDRPVSLFVADFIGSPPMSFLPFRGSRQRRATDSVRVDSVDIALPEVREGIADTELVLGVRPEHIELVRRCAASRRSRRRRVPGHDADRHAEHGHRRQHEGPHSGGYPRAAGREHRAPVPPRPIVAVRQGVRPRASHGTARRGRAWLSSSSTA